jgi:phosphotransferase family enzyme
MSGSVDRAAVEDWIRVHVQPVGTIETAHERPWATVLRVPLADGVAWFKACAPVQAFEPRLTARLFARWPDRVAEVLGYDEERAWLLLADAGTRIRELGNPPETWLVALPLYAELQRSEAAHTHDHLAHGVPDLRLETLPARYEDLLRHDLPLDPDEIRRLREFAPRFAELCDELAAHDVPETVQHDDLHMANVYAQGERLRVLDWGDASISHPFASLVVTFRFLEERNKLPPADPWFARLRDAYLEPWGPGLDGVFALATRVGTFAHAFAWARQRDHLPEEARAEFDRWYPIVLRRAIAQAL